MNWEEIQIFLFSNQWLFVIALVINFSVLISAVMHKLLQHRKESKITNMFDENGNTKRKTIHELPLATCALITLVIFSLWVAVRMW